MVGLIYVSAICMNGKIPSRTIWEEIQFYNSNIIRLSLELFWSNLFSYNTAAPSLITYIIWFKVAGATKTVVGREMNECDLSGRSPGNISNFCVLPDSSSFHGLLSERLEHGLQCLIVPFYTRAPCSLEKKNPEKLRKYTRKYKLSVILSYKNINTFRYTFIYTQLANTHTHTNIHTCICSVS